MNSAGRRGAKPTSTLTMPSAWSCGVVVSASAFTKYRIAGRLAGEGAAAEQVVHERAGGETDLRPERLVVGLEDRELEAAHQALLDEERQAPHRDVAIVRVPRVVEAVHRPGAPAGDAGRERADGVHRLGVQEAVLRIRHRHAYAEHAADVGLEAGGRLPHAAAAIDARHHASNRAARIDVLAHAIRRDHDLWPPDAGMVFHDAGAEVLQFLQHAVWCLHRRFDVGNQKGALLLAERTRRAPEPRADGRVAGVAGTLRQEQQVEEIDLLVELLIGLVVFVFVGHPAVVAAAECFGGSAPR